MQFIAVVFFGWPGPISHISVGSKLYLIPKCRARFKVLWRYI